MKRITVLACAALVACLAVVADAADDAGAKKTAKKATKNSQAANGLTKGTPKIEAAGPITFGPDGVLFLGDPQQASVFAIDTGDKSGKARGAVNVEDLGGKVAAALGTEAQNVQVVDMAVNPASGQVYLSVARGRGPQAQAVLLRVGADGKLQEVPLKNVPFAQAALPNPPADATTGQGPRARNNRRESITDMAYADGRLIVAGLSNEEFASKLRSIPFPFQGEGQGASVEVYHGAHGALETRSPVRTFVTFDIEGDPHLLAAYTCTPLVKFPLKQLLPGEKVRGTTVAELGNRNRPLDMVVYSKDGQDYLLIANSARGVMKVKTAGIEDIEPIDEKISGTAGLPYETVGNLEGVEQLDRLDADRCVVLLNKDGQMSLQTVDLP